MRLEAFGTLALVAVADAGAGDGALERAVASVRRTVTEFDQACSRFRPDSELCALNAAAGTAVRVGPVLLEAVSAALRAARLTDGDVDPTVGEALIALGYDRDFAELEPGRRVTFAAVPGWRSVRVDRAAATVSLARGVRLDLGATAKALAADRAVGEALIALGYDRDFDDLVAGGAAVSRPVASIPGWRTVQVDADESTIRTAPGVLIDLGATAKALAADRAAAAARDQAGCGALVSFGGDLAIAGAAPAAGWRVRVTDDHRAGVDAPGQSIVLRSGGLATSSVAVRRWRTAGGGSAHHLVDPATAQPVDGVWRTVSVSAASCLDANIASTASIIRGLPAVEWLSGMELPSRLVGVDGTVRHLAGWPVAGDDLPLFDSSVAVA